MMTQYIEFASVQGGKFHRLADRNVERNDGWKPRLMLCGRTLEPVNYFTTAEDANKYTGGRLAKYVCTQCEAHHTKQFDIAISGQMGFYTIVAESAKGKRWAKRVQGFDGHAAYCDSTRMTEDIADGAFDAGLRVSVNSRRYVGNGKVAA